MRISSLEEYGLRCLLAIGEQKPPGQMSIPEIAEQEGLSIPYTSKLMSILRRAGLVKAVRGRSGGFTLTRAPKDITLLDILTSLGGPLLDPDHCTKYSGQLDECVHMSDCNVHSVLGSLASFVGGMLARTSLQDMLDQTASASLISSEELINSGNIINMHHANSKRMDAFDCNPNDGKEL